MQFLTRELFVRSVPVFNKILNAVLFNSFDVKLVNTLKMHYQFELSLAPDKLIKKHMILVQMKYCLSFSNIIKN